MKQYYPRELAGHLKKYLQAFPVVGITGPRQAGKSTLLMQELGSEYRYVTFDDREIIEQFYDDPKRFMDRYKNKVIFDEVQKVPEIFDAIKLIVDQNRDEYGQFILTGSSQFTMVKSITESLAGRIGLLTLLPLQYTEMPEQARSESLYKGGYPELIKRQFKYSDDWYKAYLTTYLEKDVRQLLNIGNIKDLHNLIRLLAANVSQQLNVTQLALDVGVSVATIKRWISILEASYIIFLLPPFYNNYGKRITKRSKLYFYDAGLVAYLIRITTNELFHHGPMTGALFENYIISEVKKKISHSNSHSDLYFLRTEHGVEVDLIIDHVSYKEWIEIKHNSTFKPSMVKAIFTFMASDDQGFLVYTGPTQQYDTHVERMHYQDFLGRS